MIKIIILIATFTITTFSNEAPVYIQTISGKPNMTYFNKEKKAAKKLGINIRYEFKGCIVNQKNNKNSDINKLLRRKQRSFLSDQKEFSVS